MIEVKNIRKEFISYKHYDEKGNKQMFIAF